MENGKSFNQQSLECAWRQIHDILFHPGTGMVYDYVTSHDPNHRFDHLPSPEEIAAGFPNPCGWSTGMEDCALNGGILLDLMRFRGWENSVFAAKRFDFFGVTAERAVYFFKRGAFIKPRRY